MKDITYEVCPHCDHEVELEAELKVQKCPNCGRYIVTCSMCPADENGGYPCQTCPLEHLVGVLEKERTPLSACLLDKSEKGMFNFINDYWDDVRGGLESMAVYDMHDDVELCYMACFYGAVNAVEYKHEARYWIGGNSVDKAEKIDNLADLIDSAVDIDDILNDTEFYKSYVDIDKLKNR